MQVCKIELRAMYTWGDCIATKIFDKRICFIGL